MPNKMPKERKFHLGNRKLKICILGFLIGLFGILCGMFFDDIIMGIIEKQMILRPDSEVFDKWKTPPLELNLDIYLFNWTNPEQLKNFSAKPNFEQLGPYRFNEIPDKVDIKWNPHNESITYRKKSLFFFDETYSNGSLNDVVCTLNAVALSAAAKAKQWSNVRRTMVDVGLKLYNQQMSVIKTVDEILFTGYSDNLIDMARSVSIFGKDVEVPFDRFGWFYTRNGSADLTGVFNVFTGADDIKKIGQMHSWNYKTNTGFFDADCGLTYGSAGEFQPPNLKMYGSVALFTPDMCRTVILDYVETVEVRGVKGYKYAGGKRSVDNGTEFSENLCFCNGECVPSGVMNISSCRFDSPVFMSYPHFYNADPYYTEQVDGLEPNQNDHEFYMILEPKTGVALEVAARFQVNMMVEPIESISLYEDIPRTFLPLIWFEQKVQINAELADKLKLISIVLTVGQILASVCFAIGLIMLLWYPLEQFYLKKRNRKTSLHPQNTNKNVTLHSITNSGNTKAANDVDKMRPDCSPLLDTNRKAPNILIKSTTNDSMFSNSTTTTTSPAFDN